MSYLRNFSDSIVALGGSELVDLGHLRGVLTHQAMFNRFYDAGYPSRVVPADVARVSGAALQRNVRPVWILDADVIDPTLENELQGAGFDTHLSWTGMWHSLREIQQTPTPSGFSIRQAVDERDLQIWAKVCSDTEHYTEEQAALFCDLFTTLGLTSWTHLIAEFDGLPAATASLFTCDRIAAIDWVNTLPHARRLGIAAHLVTLLLEKAHLSSDLVVLTSSEMAEPLYRKLGFEECSRIFAYRMS